ncbi:hypothetical protein EV668_4038 [Enterovirga rhinocerotis]|uniref:Uncharacterized protein n=1 Tax=Enterovirga rhinocerotis TaxID=1339210 RepID=A0A4R7BVE1_9HYPH|nr:hypothetical protein EV668_4038 [Enterovirga rhinocerotis]
MGARFKSAGLTVGPLRVLEQKRVADAKLKRCDDWLIGL